VRLPSNAPQTAPTVNPQNKHQQPTIERPNANQANMNTTITFQPDGTAQCLWTEALPLHELGRLEVSRASNLEFNNTSQQWEVKDRRGKVRFIAKSRSACLEWEQTNL
jgi:hypothetical protein